MTGKFTSQRSIVVWDYTRWKAILHQRYVTIMLIHKMENFLCIFSSISTLLSSQMSRLYLRITGDNQPAFLHPKCTAKSPPCNALYGPLAMTYETATRPGPNCLMQSGRCGQAETKKVSNRSAWSQQVCRKVVDLKACVHRAHFLEDKRKVYSKTNSKT